jgi:hypothetical protein
MIDFFAQTTSTALHARGSSSLFVVDEKTAAVVMSAGWSCTAVCGVRTAMPESEPRRPIGALQGATLRSVVELTASSNWARPTGFSRTAATTPSAAAARASGVTSETRAMTEM